MTHMCSSSRSFRQVAKRREILKCIYTVLIKMRFTGNVELRELRPLRFILGFERGNGLRHDSLGV